MPKFAMLVKKVKQFAKDPNISDEEFLDTFISAYVSAENICNKNGDALHLDKAATSLLLNQKADVPRNLRKALQRYGIKERTTDGMSDFVADYLDPASLEQLTDVLLQLIQNDHMISVADKEVLSNHRDDPATLLAELMIRSLSECNIASEKRKILWKNGSNAVEVITGDLFRYGFDNRKKTEKNIVVIPVNTAFDTHVTRKLEGEACPVVADTTIHGQWLTRMVQSGTSVAELDKRISESLACLGYQSTKAKKAVNGKDELYDIGSVAVIETNNAIYFLLAISEFNVENHAMSSPDSIETAIRSLLQVYDKIGQGYDLYLPIMGTGRSRTGLKYTEVYLLLRKALINNSQLIQGHIFIVVKPENMDEIEEVERDVSH